MLLIQCTFTVVQQTSQIRHFRFERSGALLILGRLVFEPIQCVQQSLGFGLRSFQPLVQVRSLLKEIRSAGQYDLAYTFHSFDYLYPAYIRGLAYLESGDGRSAAGEFQKLIDNPGLCWEYITCPLARLQLGRAQRLMGDNASARESYEEFLTIWKDADPDLPVYRQAKAEYAQLQKSR